MKRLSSCMGVALAALALWAMPASAEAPSDRASAWGYLRVMTRPDLQGGNGRLGFWNLYGRLLNEGPYAELNLKLDVLQATRAGDPYASVVARVSALSVPHADPLNGSLGAARLAQLYVQAGNVLLDKVTWQLGTIETYWSDLHLYDFRPASLMENMLGVSARYNHDRLDVLVGVGDSGYAVRGAQYSTLFTAGASATVRAVPSHLELGVGAQFIYEPEVEGNRFAPYNTPGVDYEDFYRREVVERYLEENPGQEDLFPRPEPTTSRSWRVVGYVGFGGFGPLKWTKILGRYEKLHPQNFYEETASGRVFPIFIQGLTDQRYHFELGQETWFVLWPDRLELLWAAFYGGDRNRDNTIAAGEDNRTYYSTVLRLQAFLTRTLHLLTEGSVAQEKSENGNLFREHFDSIFQNTGGTPDARGLEFGDADVRSTFQLKTGLVINPTGPGIFTRPSLRLLYGLQYSNQQAAYGNGFSESLSQYNYFVGTERHWHSVLAIEAEAWF